MHTYPHICIHSYIYTYILITEIGKNVNAVVESARLGFTKGVSFLGIFMYIYVYIYIYIYTYKYMYIHIYIYTFVFICKWDSQRGSS
jgi:hypothetical protein